MRSRLPLLNLSYAEALYFGVTAHLINSRADYPFAFAVSDNTTLRVSNRQRSDLPSCMISFRLRIEQRCHHAIKRDGGMLATQ